MTDTKQKTIGIFLPDGFADWEFGLLAGGAAEHLGAKVLFLTEGAQTVRSIGGLTASGSRGTDADANADLDALALIGSDDWTGPNPPDVAVLANSVLARGGVVGGICAATVGLARAGLLEGRRHTSNGQAWIAEMTGGYSGSDGYAETPAAVADGLIVTAPGTAPVSFAMTFLSAVYPEAAEMLAGARAMYGAEHSG
jgi:putative intracellular protease/amidase